MKFTKFTPDYLAGLATGSGLALFGVFLITSSADLGLPAAYRFTFGLLGFVLFNAGTFGKLRIEKSHQD